MVPVLIKKIMMLELFGTVRVLVANNVLPWFVMTDSRFTLANGLKLYCCFVKVAFQLVKGFLVFLVLLF